MKKITTKWAAGALILLGFAACKKNGPDPEPKPDPVKVVNLSITELKARSTAASVTLGEEGKLLKVKGVVISDKEAANIDAKTAVITQDDNAAGIVVNFAATHNLPLGTEVEISVSNQKLVQQNGEIVLDAIPLDSATTKAANKTVTPKEATIAGINTNKAAWNGTLVSLGAGTFNGSGQYNGALSYVAEGESIKSLITNDATFKGTHYPALVNGLTGIVRISGEEVFLNIRNTTDVKHPETFIIVEDFSGAEENFFVTLASQRIYPKTIPTDTTRKYIAAERIPFAEAGWDFYNGSPVRIKEAGATDDDADFLAAGRKYLWALPSLTPSLFNNPNKLLLNNRLTNSFRFFRGLSNTNTVFDKLKSITIVVAGSKTTSSFWSNDYYKDFIDFSAFETGSDGFQVHLMRGASNGPLESSAVFHNQGQWQTVKFDNIADKFTAADNEVGYDDFFYLSVESPRERVTMKRGTTNVVGGNPVVIDKIILEFSEKPSWAE